MDVEVHCLSLLLGGLLALSVQPVQAGHDAEEINTISPSRVRELIERGERIVLIDLRTAKEYEQKRLPGARSIPVAELEKRLREVPRSGQVVLYCACRPGEEAYAYFLLRDQGYRNAVMLEDGFPGWLKNKLPVETTRR